jgi:antitoxin (DNA-binding transcriptional repressor) of toxin-antitoxin stability system
MKVVDIHRAKTHPSRRLERAHAGEEMVIAKGNEPCARLTPLPGRLPKREPRTLAGPVDLGRGFFEPLPPGWTVSGARIWIW